MPTESLQTRPKPPWQRERAKVGYVASCYWMDLWRSLKHSSCAPRFTTKMSAIEEPGRRFLRGWGFHPEGRSENGNHMAMERGRGGGTLSDVYQNSKRLLLKTRDGLERLERLESPSSISIAVPGAGTVGLGLPELSFAIKRDISQLQSLCVEMDHMWRSITVKPQRDLWKRKVEQVAEELDSLKESLDKYFLRVQRQTQEARERTELLGRVNGDSAHVLRIFDDEAQAMQSARNSTRMMEEAYSTGVAILSKFSEQRERVKSAQRKALDILNTVGLSNSVLRLIERRNRVDRWIKYMGMILTFVVVILFWRYTR